MKKWLTIFLSVIVFTVLNAKVLTIEKQGPVSSEYTKSISEYQNHNLLAVHKVIKNKNSRRTALNPNVSTVLIDSSVHGYGMVVPQTNPLTYVPGTGFVIGYRGWVLTPFTDEYGNTSSANNSGFAKASLSANGIDFTNYSGLNDEIIIPGTDGPTSADGPLMCRYPSSVANEIFPYVVWTEAINYTGSATNNGGRPMYSFDQFGWFSNAYSDIAIDINFGWSDGNEPLDAPADLWVNSPVLVDDGFNKAMVVTSTQWSSSPDPTYHEKSAYIMRGVPVFGGGTYQFSSVPQILFDQNDLGGSEATGTTSQTSIDINSSGVGYAMCTAYVTDSTQSERHNFIIRKTTDYGVTWSDDGLGGYDYYFLPDTTMERVFVESEFLPDSVLFWEIDTTTSDTLWTPTDLPGVFPLYDHEVRVDESGTLHIITTMVVESDQAGFIYVGLEGVGLYHLWTDDPSNPGSWQASQIAELSTTFSLEGMPDGNGGGNYFNVFGTSAISYQNQNAMWVAYHALGDTSAAGFNWDIFVSKSIDGGETWLEPENVTMTDGLQEDEMYVHMSPIATDSTCFFVYHQPDYSVNHLGDAGNMAAFQQNLWFATHTNNTTPLGISNGISIPDKFLLSQNFPNPFNPTTHISYNVVNTGTVELTLFNVLGQKVQTLMNEVKEPGDYSFKLNAGNLSSGVYFYKMTQQGQTLTRKLVLMK